MTAVSASIASSAASADAPASTAIGTESATDLGLLIAERDMLAQAFEAQDAARLIVGPDGLILRCNGLATEIFGLPTQGFSVRDRVFRHIDRRHARRVSDVSHTPEPYGFELLADFRANPRSLRERAIIRVPMRGQMSAIISIEPIGLHRGASFKVEITEIGSLDADQLTQLLLEEEFKLRLADLIAGIEHGEWPCIFLVYIDADDFKRWNDLHGHAVGDQLIEGLGARIGACPKRSSDLVARLHGDEFTVAGIGDRGVGHRIAERIRHAIAAAPFAVRTNDDTDVEIWLTASLGVAAYETDMTAEMLLAAGDAMLAVSKQGGKNAVTGSMPAQAPPPDE